ncbi:MAG: amino acid permease [Oscillospiraceae bacterium]|nr:amino acid permease [Oscillospiraceae bacterium]
MENQLKRKYGLLMAMCMVVGTIIGSGIFFQNERVITYIGGRMWIGIAAWAVGGLITLSLAYVASTLATRHEKVGGLVDYTEALVGKSYSYVFGWFLATIFYPAMTGTLAFVTARFTVELFGWNTAYGVNQFLSGETWALALFYLVLIYAVNGLSTKISEKIQISGTFIKVIPLILMGIVGTIFGLVNGVTLENLNFTATHVGRVYNEYGQLVTEGTLVGARTAMSAFFYALVATAFAYAGWDCVINLNSEIKDAKRNLPKALIVGMIIITSIYVAYFVGIFGASPVESAVAAGGVGTRTGFMAVFGDFAGTLLFVFIIISCIGTLNGLTVASQRSIYAISARNTGPRPRLFGQIDKETNMPNNSIFLSMIFIAAWMVVIFAHNSMSNPPFNSINESLHGFNFSIVAFAPVGLCMLLLPLLVQVIHKQKDFGVFNRFIAPTLAIIGTLFLMYATWYQQRNIVFIFLIVLSVLSIIGLLLTFGKDKTPMRGVTAWICGFVLVIVVSVVLLVVLNSVA